MSPSKTKQALEAARKLEAAARTAADAASKRCEGLLADRRNLAKRVSALEQKVAAAGTRARLEKRLDQVRTARAALDDAQKELDLADRAERAARQELDEIAGVLDKAAQAFHGRRDALVGCGLDVPPTTSDLVKDWDGLCAWSVEQAPIQHERQAAATSRAAERTALVEKLVEELVLTAANAGIALPAWVPSRS